MSNMAFFESNHNNITLFIENSVHQLLMTTGRSSVVLLLIAYSVRVSVHPITKDPVRKYTS